MTSEWKSDPFQDLRAALEGEELSGRTNPGVWVDPTRRRRTGVPEIVLAEGKTIEQLLAAIDLLLEREGRVLVSRVQPSQFEAIRTRFASVPVRTAPSKRTLVLRRDECAVQPSGGRVGILTAGAADRPAAEEAQLVAEELGCLVRVIHDVGVAGLHRLVPALRDLVSEWDADVLIVAAGMDGVLPSVVAGLVSVPVIGLPTPVGYGIGGQGEAALYSMLQSCAPGLVVVNIDNGVGAGAAAAKIANRCAGQRRQRESSDEAASRANRSASFR